MKRFFQLSLIFVFLAFILLVFFKINIKETYRVINNKWNSISPFHPKAKGPQEHWINIFIHGTFNCGIGLLNVFDVINDEIVGTGYAKRIKKIRKDPFFYQEQAILQRGLVKLSSESLIEKLENKLAIYPIMSAFEDVSNIIESSNQIVNHYYSFGWTGLISQNFRRKEALRLYNAINEEVEEFAKKGIKPKIRLLAHSHGGNVCLNLAAINEAMANTKSYMKLDFGFVTPEDYRSIAIDSVEQMKKLIFSTQIKEKAKTLKGQKIFDYIPGEDPLIIDEFLAFGTPLQIETCYLFFSNTFRKSFNIYSSQDYVQTMDIISTKKYLNKQRISCSLKNPCNRFIQLKIMGDRSVDKLGTEEEKEEVSILLNFLSNIFSTSKESRDPSHKDLWFFAWNPEFTQPNYIFSPIPMVVFTPLILNLIKNEPHDDLDLNIRVDNDFFIFDLLKHSSAVVLAEVKLPMKFFSEVKEKCLKWKPENLTKELANKKLQLKVSQ